MLENIIAEMTELFPSKVYHIGADEVNMNSWRDCEVCQNLMKEKEMTELVELQNHFVRRIEKILAKYGKTMAGWDEILDGGNLFLGLLETADNVGLIFNLGHCGFGTHDYITHALTGNAVVLSDFCEGEILVVIEVVKLFLTLSEQITVKIEQQSHAVSLIFHHYAPPKCHCVKLICFTMVYYTIDVVESQ